MGLSKQRESYICLWGLTTKGLTIKTIKEA
jgi:hypothetical protein